MAQPHSRRSIIPRLAAIGGAGAAHEAMLALNLLPGTAHATVPALPPWSGNSKRIAVLGAGVGGLCAAYELDSDVWDDWVFSNARFHWRTSLLEPVGGMDNFRRGLARQPRADGRVTVADLVRLASPVTGIGTMEEGVAIAWQDGGTLRTERFDHAISNIPMAQFRRLATNLPARVRQAAADLPLMAWSGWQGGRSSAPTRRSVRSTAHPPAERRLTGNTAPTGSPGHPSAACWRRAAGGADHGLRHHRLGRDGCGST